MLGLMVRRGPVRHRKVWGAAALSAVALAAGFAWFAGLPGLVQHRLIQAGKTTVTADSLWLPRYHAVIDAMPITGVAANLSGLTFSPETGTLFATLNRPPEIIELSTGGQVLRHIPLSGGKDVESITHVQGDRFLILDEATSVIHEAHIGPETRAIDLTESRSVPLRTTLMSNFGFEGMSWDQHTQILFVTQEMLPTRVLAVSGLEAALAGDGRRLTVTEWRPGLLAGHAALDLTSVTVHDANGHILLLSHMSELLSEFAPDGTPVSLMSLRGGNHGLRDLVPQAEGLALGEDQTIYIVSEPNLFYRFEPRGPGPRTASD